MKPAFEYPPTPTGVPPSVTQPSPAFRKEVSKVMASIIFFFVVYLLLFLLSIALVIGCFYAGVAIITSVGHLLAMLAGLGLMGLGVMVFVFLIKFMFAVSKYDRSGIIEVTEQDQPMLFGFIRQLTKDTQTPFPRRIYLSADVNACVFYDSSFWSMLLPVKKNLQIGLGLVNAINLSEFKAVMAHEFGHFSQRSMKLGSFVYQVNNIIYNMLFKNKDYSSFLQGWANIHSIFAMFASLTASIANGIQWILRRLYGVINKSYMSLSREMEFHADAVAGSVSGTQSPVSALRRLDIAHAAYTVSLRKCDEWLKDNKITKNIYPNHSFVMRRLAGEHNLPLENGLPVITAAFMASNKSSRINYKDQWASHPTTDEREAHLQQWNVNAAVNTESAWVLFADREQWQERLTAKIYEGVSVPADASAANEEEFEKTMTEEQQQFSYASQYNGFYDNRQVTVLEPDQLVAATDAGTRFNTLFTPEHAALFKQQKVNENDLAVVKAISEKKIQTKTFDFDGARFRQTDAPEIANRLEAEQKELEEKIMALDTLAVQYFLGLAAAKGEEESLKEGYVKYFEWRKKADLFLQRINDMFALLGPIYGGQRMQVEDIKSLINQVKRDHEPEVKRSMNYWMEQGVFASDPVLQQRVGKFVSANYVYFGKSSFFEVELKELHAVCNSSWGTLQEFLFHRFKAITALQLRLAGQ